MQSVLRRRSGALADMRKHGVEAVDCYSVDNALVRPGSPSFIAHCWQRNTDCGEPSGFLHSRLTTPPLSCLLCIKSLRCQTSWEPDDELNESMETNQL